MFVVRAIRGMTAMIVHMKTSEEASVILEKQVDLDAVTIIDLLDHHRHGLPAIETAAFAQEIEPQIDLSDVTDTGRDLLIVETDAIGPLAREHARGMRGNLNTPTLAALHEMSPMCRFWLLTTSICEFKPFRQKASS